MKMETRTLSEFLRPGLNPYRIFRDVFFDTDRESRLQEIFLSTAAELLAKDSACHVFFFSPTGLPKEDPRLQHLRSNPRFHSVAGDFEARQALERLISLRQETITHSPLYLFAEGIDRFLSPRSLELLVRLLQQEGPLSACLSATPSTCPLSVVSIVRCIRSLPQFLRVSVFRNTVTWGKDQVFLLVPSGDVPGRGRPFPKENTEHIRTRTCETHKARRHTPPTRTQILLAVTAALLSLLGLLISRTGGFT